MNRKHVSVTAISLYLAACGGGGGGGTTPQPPPPPPPPANMAPSASIAASMTDIIEGGQISLDASGSSDPDGDTLTYMWTQVSGSAANIVSPTGISTDVIFTEVDADETARFELTVSDGTATGTATVDINVADIPVPDPKAGTARFERIDSLGLDFEPGNLFEGNRSRSFPGNDKTGSVIIELRDPATDEILIGEYYTDENNENRFILSGGDLRFASDAKFGQTELAPLPVFSESEDSVTFVLAELFGGPNGGDGFLSNTSSLSIEAPCAVWSDFFGGYRPSPDVSTSEYLVGTRNGLYRIFVDVDESSPENRGILDIRQEILETSGEFCALPNESLSVETTGSGAPLFKTIIAALNTDSNDLHLYERREASSFDQPDTLVAAGVQQLDVGELAGLEFVDWSLRTGVDGTLQNTFFVLMKDGATEARHRLAQVRLDPALPASGNVGLDDIRGWTSGNATALVSIGSFDTEAGSDFDLIVVDPNLPYLRLYPIVNNFCSGNPPDPNCESRREFAGEAYFTPTELGITFATSDLINDENILLLSNPGGQRLLRYGSDRF